MSRVIQCSLTLPYHLCPIPTEPLRCFPSCPVLVPSQSDHTEPPRRLRHTGSFPDLHTFLPVQCPPVQCPLAALSHLSTPARRDTTRCGKLGVVIRAVTAGLFLPIASRYTAVGIPAIDRDGAGLGTFQAADITPERGPAVQPARPSGTASTAQRYSQHGPAVQPARPSGTASTAQRCPAVRPAATSSGQRYSQHGPAASGQQLSASRGWPTAGAATESGWARFELRGSAGRRGGKGDSEQLCTSRLPWDRAGSSVHFPGSRSAVSPAAAALVKPSRTDSTETTVQTNCRRQ